MERMINCELLNFLQIINIHLVLVSQAKAAAQYLRVLLQTIELGSSLNSNLETFYQDLCLKYFQQAQDHDYKYSCFKRDTHSD